MEVLKRLFERYFHSPVVRVQPLQGQLGGSGRKIIRLSGDKLSAIGILYDVREEDLGSPTLFEFLADHRAGAAIAPEAVAAYRKVVAVLPRFQVEAGRDLNYKVCYPRASFDRQSIAWDLNY